MALLWKENEAMKITNDQMQAYLDSVRDQLEGSGLTRHEIELVVKAIEEDPDTPSSSEVVEFVKSQEEFKLILQELFRRAAAKDTDGTDTNTNQ